MWTNWFRYQKRQNATRKHDLSPLRDPRCHPGFAKDSRIPRKQPSGCMMAVKDIADFAKGSGSWHVANQARFMRDVDFARSFDVEEMRPLLTKS